MVIAWIAFALAMAVVEVASVAQNLGSALKTAANQVIDLTPLFATFEAM